MLEVTVSAAAGRQSCAVAWMEHHGGAHDETPGVGQGSGYTRHGAAITQSQVPAQRWRSAEHEPLASTPPLERATAVPCRRS